MTFIDAPINDPAPEAAEPVAAEATPLTPEQAAEARIEAFFRDAEPESPDDASGIDDEGGDPDPDPDEMPYRDAKRLREELKADRERWRPYEESFGRLHETDRTLMRETLELLAADPAAAAARFEAFAEAIRAKTGAGPAQDAGASADGASPEATGDGPLTRADVERLFAEREEQARIEHQQNVMLTEIRELGYDPDADVNTDAWIDFKMLVDVAATLDGDIAKAHERIRGRFQKEIDSFVEERRADAGRPVMTGAQGSGPALPQREIKTAADAEAAMNARLDAQFGAARRR